MKRVNLSDSKQMANMSEQHSAPLFHGGACSRCCHPRAFRNAHRLRHLPLQNIFLSDGPILPRPRQIQDEPLPVDLERLRSSVSGHRCVAAAKLQDSLSPEVCFDQFMLCLSSSSNVMPPKLCKAVCPQGVLAHSGQLLALLQAKNIVAPYLFICSGQSCMNLAMIWSVVEHFNLCPNRVLAISRNTSAMGLNGFSIKPNSSSSPMSDAVISAVLDTLCSWNYSFIIEDNQEQILDMLCSVMRIPAHFDLQVVPVHITYDVSLEELQTKDSLNPVDLVNPEKWPSPKTGRAWVNFSQPFLLTDYLQHNSKTADFVPHMRHSIYQAKLFSSTELLSFVLSFPRKELKSASDLLEELKTLFHQVHDVKKRETCFSDVSMDELEHAVKCLSPMVTIGKDQVIVLPSAKQILRNKAQTLVNLFLPECAAALALGVVLRVPLDRLRDSHIPKFVPLADLHGLIHKVLSLLSRSFTALYPPCYENVLLKMTQEALSFLKDQLRILKDALPAGTSRIDISSKNWQTIFHLQGLIAPWLKQFNDYVEKLKCGEEPDNLPDVIERLKDMRVLGHDSLLCLPFKKRGALDNLHAEIQLLLIN